MCTAREKIRAAAEARGITQLFHFTPDRNLASILTYGLHSRTALENAGVPYVTPDAHRMDRYPDGICISIHGINTEMLRAKRKIYPHWAIIVLDASVLWTHSCRFCWKNAASTEIVLHKGFIGGPWAFKEMFFDPVVGRSRAELGRLDYQPTDPASEVQVFDPIHPDLFLGVIVEHAPERELVEAHLRDIGRDVPVVVEPDIFI